MYSSGYSTIVTAVDIQFGAGCGQVLRGAACLKKNMLDSYFLKEVDDEQVALFEFNKGWKLSGIQKSYYNCLVKELGGFGTDPGKFIWPTSVTMTLDGDLAVKDSGNEQIQLFCSEGLYKHRFSYGSGPVKGLGDIVCIQDGLLLVTDGSKAIKVFSRDGEMIHHLKSPDMDWNHSYGMAILKSNDIAITDWTDLGKMHIIRIDLRMSAITRMYVMDGFHRPEHIAVNKREEMLVTEGQLFGKKQGSCLKVVNKDRIQKKTTGPSYENRITFVNPSGVCVDFDENFFVADRGQNYIVMFNPDASLVALVVTENLEGPCTDV